MKNINTKIIILGVLGLVIFAFAPTIYFFRQYRQSRQQLMTVNQESGDSSKQLLDRLGRLMVLPEGEEPTIATISDKDKLKDQPFFAQAKNGDILIIYTKAQKAILYDKESNRIIDIVTLNLE